MPDAWPDSLPQCLPVDGQGEGLADERIRSQPDAGPALVRRRSTAGVRPFSGIVILDRAQLDMLRSFVDETLDGGTLPFSFPAQSEAGTWLVRFDELPKWQRRGVRYQVALQLEILP